MGEPTRWPNYDGMMWVPSVHVEMVKKKKSSMHEVWGTHCIIDALIVSHLGSIMSHSLRFLALFQDL